MGKHSKGNATLTAARMIKLVDTTGTEHAVPVALAEAGRQRGTYTTQCGGLIESASLVTPPARACLLCHPPAWLSVPAPRRGR